MYTPQADVRFQDFRIFMRFQFSTLHTCLAFTLQAVVWFILSKKISICFQNFRFFMGFKFFMLPLCTQVLVTFSKYLYNFLMCYKTCPFKFYMDKASTPIVSTILEVCLSSCSILLNSSLQKVQHRISCSFYLQLINMYV